MLQMSNMYLLRSPEQNFSLKTRKPLEVRTATWVSQVAARLDAFFVGSVLPTVWDFGKSPVHTST